MQKHSNSSDVQNTRSFHSWVEVNRAALRHNLHVIKQQAGPAGIIAVVKANAYGHGLEEVATTIAHEVACFAVASCEEALRLKKVVCGKPIMLLSAAFESEYPLIAEHQFIPIISSVKEAKAFAAVAPRGALIHVMIDTGMGRLGLATATACDMIQEMQKLPVAIQSISTHLSSADTDERGTEEQLMVFETLLEKLQQMVPHAAIHVLNSAGLLRFSQQAHDLVRIGLMIYGIAPIASFQELLQPVMTWKARVALVYPLSAGCTISYEKTYTASQEMTVAVIPVGYADGYFRHLSNQEAVVLIHGKRCPLLGRVTMDQIVVDISEAGSVSIGDEVVLLGKQGDEEIQAAWLAAKAGTISWHLFTSIGQRVHRVLV